MFAFFSPPRLTQFLAIDARNISRDPTLVFACIFSVVPMLALAFLGDSLDQFTQARFDFTGLSGFLVPMVLILPALLIGWVIGFLFLEERDEGPLMAIDVTPVGRAGMMAYRVSVAALVTFVLTLVGQQVLTPEMGLPLRLLVAVMIALEAIAAAIILPAIARNKVEGLAVTKLTNIVSIAPLLALIPSPLRYLGGFIPSFWIGEVFQLSSTDYLPQWVDLTAMIVTHVLVMLLLFRIATRKVL